MRAPLIAVLLLAVAAPARAATDGVRGATSTATFEVSTTVENQAADTVRVSGLTDIDFGTIELEDPFPFGDARSSPLCLYHTSPTFALTVTQVGGGVGTPFRLIGPSGDSVPLRVSVFNTEVGGAFPVGEAGFSVGNLVANRQDPTCADGTIAELNVARPPITFGLLNGVYSATIQIVMAVE